MNELRYVQSSFFKGFFISIIIIQFCIVIQLRFAALINKTVKYKLDKQKMKSKFLKLLFKPFFGGKILFLFSNSYNWYNLAY